ncbi:MAG: hypothetical protein WCG47_24390 [Dermatophilaceae bacterium]
MSITARDLDWAAIGYDWMKVVAEAAKLRWYVRATERVEDGEGCG